MAPPAITYTIMPHAVNYDANDSGMNGSSSVNAADGGAGMDLLSAAADSAAAMMDSSIVEGAPGGTISRRSNQQSAGGSDQMFDLQPQGRRYSSFIPEIPPPQPQPGAVNHDANDSGMNGTAMMELSRVEGVPGGTTPRRSNQQSAGGSNQMLISSPRDVAIPFSSKRSLHPSPSQAITAPRDTGRRTTIVARLSQITIRTKPNYHGSPTATSIICSSSSSRTIPANATHGSSITTTSSSSSRPILANPPSTFILRALTPCLPLATSLPLVQTPPLDSFIVAVLIILTHLQEGPAR